MTNPIFSLSTINFSCYSSPCCIIIFFHHLNQKNKEEKMSIVAEIPGFFQVFSDGSIKRFAQETVHASSEQEPSNSKGYMFKDVVIDTSKPITARVFLPNAPGSTTTQLLPLLVYFHGGGFCFGSTTWSGYHHFLADFSVASQSIVVSVDYRLAPEHRLPVAYEDCYSSLEWLAHQVGTEPWLSQADLSRVFLSGDSAGGNIAHNVAVKWIREPINNVDIKGLVLIHPYFGSEARTEEERGRDDAAGHVATHDMLWGLSVPEGSNRDYFGCNFEKGEVMSESQWRRFPAVMVHVAGLDFLKHRGVMYAEFLQRKQVKEVKLVEAEEVSHVFHVFFPESEATRLLQRQSIEFIKSH